MEKVRELLEYYGMDMAKEAIDQIKHRKRDTQYQQLRDKLLTDLRKIVYGCVPKEKNAVLNREKDWGREMWNRCCAKTLSNLKERLG